MAPEDVLFPGVIRENWQMMTWERIALTGVLCRLRPRLSLEIGVYFGGSLSLTSQYADRVIAIDIDPEVRGRFQVPHNVDLRIGSSTDLIPRTIEEIQRGSIPLNFVLIDADHSALGVRRDIELVLQYRPQAPMIMLVHDSGNPGCREGILSADWASNPNVLVVDCDFVPGQVIEHTVANGRGEVWGGFALAYLSHQTREGDVEIRQSARTSISCVHAYMRGELAL